MIPTKKHPDIEKLLTHMSPVGLSRQEAVARELCAFCGGCAKSFKDGLSIREYEISGLCQTCQDETFGGE